MCTRLKHRAKFLVSRNVTWGVSSIDKTENSLFVVCVFMCKLRQTDLSGQLELQFFIYLLSQCIFLFFVCLFAVTFAALALQIPHRSPTVKIHLTDMNTRWLILAYIHLHMWYARQLSLIWSCYIDTHSHTETPLLVGCLLTLFVRLRGFFGLSQADLITPL